ncbi:cysteine and tyrosine-rich protein 1 [Diachasma alloeum]|uniref:cysteine and tyrosine-rich protein 1 n=1 Tax=Diachasma alloeum TaxID=454923 RepID=UPI0007382AC3|nr:cysteine and tyrosine-rich protein 1 [Diachasma alloeum]
MPRSVLVLLIALGVVAVQGMDCNFGTSSNIFEKALAHCPGILDSSDKEYCCIGKENFYCCNAEEFALKTGLIVVIPAIIGVIAVVSIIIFCISCLCCSCCPWYRRRHRGTVYGKVHTPTVVTVVQPNTVPAPQPQLYPTLSTASPLPAQPPPYTQEVYAKQAAYNPTYQP